MVCDAKGNPVFIHTVHCHVLPYNATICGLYMSPQLRVHAGKVEGHLQLPFPINTIKLTMA